jgi:hypothetical protein
VLNGIDPIILFNFKKLSPSLSESIAKIPVVASIVDTIDLPVIPLYLSERLTGIYVDAESKSIEVDTSTDTLSSGDAPEMNQRGLQNTVKIEMIAKQGSIGVMLLSALSDLVFPKLTSKEYSITYLHGAVTVFGGLLHSFSLSQEAGSNLYKISLELIKPTGKFAAAGPPTVVKVTGTEPL